MTTAILIQWALLALVCVIIGFPVWYSVAVAFLIVALIEVLIVAVSTAFDWVTE